MATDRPALFNGSKSPSRKEDVMRFGTETSDPQRSCAGGDLSRAHRGQTVDGSGQAGTCGGSHLKRVDHRTQGHRPVEDQRRRERDQPGPRR